MKKSLKWLRKSLSILLLTLFSTLAFAQSADSNSADKEKNITFSISPFLTYHNGVQQEFVYQENDSGNQAKLSQLDWEQKNLLFAGIEAQAEFGSHFIIQADASFAVPGYQTGYVYDSDWDNYYNSDLEIASIKNCYSISDCDFLYYFAASLFLYFDPLPESDFDLIPFAGVDYSSNCFEACGTTRCWYNRTKNSSGYYDSWENAEESYLYGTVMTLERQSIFTWMGFSTVYRPFQNLSFSISFALNPYSFVDSLDQHYKKNMWYLDLLSQFFCGYKFQAEAEYSFNKKHSLRANFTLLSIEMDQGTTYTSYSGEKGSFYKDDSAWPGAAFNYMKASLAYRLTI